MYSDAEVKLTFTRYTIMTSCDIAGHMCSVICTGDVPSIIMSSVI